MHSPSSCTFTLFYACAVQFIGTFVQWSRYMPRSCCKRVFVVPLSLIMNNFWFYLSNLYLQCTWMYVLSFPASERFEFRQNWNVQSLVYTSACNVQSYVLRRMPTAQRFYICGTLLCCTGFHEILPVCWLIFLFAGTRYVDSNKEFLKIESSSPLDN